MNRREFLAAAPALALFPLVQTGPVVAAGYVGGRWVEYGEVSGVSGLDGTGYVRVCSEGMDRAFLAGLRDSLQGLAGEGWRLWLPVIFK